MDDEFSLVLDALPGLVWAALPSGQVDFVNQRWCEYTGLGVEEAYGSGWQSAIHPEDLPEVRERWRSILASGQPREIEARLRRFDGAYRLFLVRTSPLADASGRVVKWWGINTDIEDRTRSEEALHSRWWLWAPAREHHFRSVVENLPVLAAHVSAAGVVEHVNRRAAQYLGATLEEMRRWKITDIVYPEDSNVLFAWNRVLQSGDTYEVEGRLRRGDGVYRWFAIRGFSLRDAEGRIALWYFLVTDIDDNRRAEALLAGEKRLLEMVALGRPLPTVLDALCRLLDAAADRCWSGILLLDRTGTRVQHALAPGLPPSYNESLEGRSVSCTEGPCETAASLKTQVIVSDVTSDTRWDRNGWPALALAHGLKSCWCSPLLSLTGELLGALAIYQREPGSPTPYHQALIQQFSHIASIAIERTQSEEALKRSEAFLAKAQQLSSTGSFSWRVATDEIMWSEQLYRIFEFDQGVPVTLDLIASRVHPEDIPLFNENVNRARGDGGDFEYEHRLQMPDGSIRYVHLVAHGSRGQDGGLEYIGAVQNVTQSRLSEQALSKARSELTRVSRITTVGALTASIAHEVNQPLSGIITNASTCLRMLGADPPNIEGARETARRMIRDGSRASDVIKRLRALFAKRDVSAETVDLNEAAREVIALSFSDLQRGRVVLRAELAEDLPPVRGDRVQLQQVILNLLRNALDAMSAVDDRPRQLVITTETREDGQVRLSVQDAGVGFDRRDAERLFDAFFTTKSDGMGIGLSVSRSIIERHHGRLWGAPNDGPGATFSFSIPRSSESVTSA